MWPVTTPSLYSVLRINSSNELGIGLSRGVASFDVQLPVYALTSTTDTRHQAPVTIKTVNFLDGTLSPKYYGKLHLTYLSMISSFDPSIPCPVKMLSMYM